MENAFKFLTLGFGSAYLLNQMKWSFFLEKIISLEIIHRFFYSNSLISTFFISSIIAFIFVWFFKLHRRYQFNLGFLFISSGLFLYLLINLNKYKIFGYFAENHDVTGYLYVVYLNIFFNILICLGFFYIFLSNLPPFIEEPAENLSEQKF
ncbi:MAG: hypothetical protein RSA22_06935 [Acinetobacter sp.]